MPTYKMTCTKCHKKLQENDAYLADDQLVCWDCAEKIAQKANEKREEVEITDFNGYETFHLCQWCETLYPEDELRKKAGFDYICEYCIRELDSRGEDI